MDFIRKYSSLFIILAMMTLLPACHIGRFFYWNFAGINDYKKFPQVPVDKGGEVFYFHESDTEFQPVLPLGFLGKNKNLSFDNFLKENKTVAFLIIRNDSILYEKYFDNYADSSIIQSFSISKAFTSALTGIAIKEGYIESTVQPITDFIPELLENDPAFSKIRIEDLLNMRSGIKFNEGYSNPFADMAKYYYGLNLTKYITKLKIEEPPDQSYNYISVNSLLLGMAIERATGRQLNEYLQEKIWIPLGMEYDATMNVDSKKDNQTKVFCCVNARTRDFARFGRLYLNKGNWNGQQIIPEQWVEKSMTIINDSRDSQNYPYTYQWRVKEDGAIFAKGVLGQYIYVDPAKNVIIVRLGKKSKGVNWAGLMEEICGEL
jgi:CubicO group peptidase (beta-lactamase class C family)